MTGLGNISLLQIEIFITIAEYHNLTEAARNLFISQSAATRWMQKLESSLNTTLFVRTNKGVSLTDDGRYLYNELKPVFSKLNMTLHNTRSVSNITDNVIRVGCLEYEEIFSELAAIIKQYEQIYPGTLVQTRLYNYQNLRENLICDNIDCVFSYSLGFKELLSTSSKRFKHMDSYFAVPASFEATYTPVLDTSKLAGKDIYLHPLAELKDAEQRAINVCQAHGFMPKRIKYVTERPALEAAIKDGNGFTITGPDFGLRFGSAIRLYKIDRRLEEEQYMIITWRPANCLTHVKRFIDFVPDADSYELYKW